MDDVVVLRFTPRVAAIVRHAGLCNELNSFPVDYSMAVEVPLSKGKATDLLAFVEKNYERHKGPDKKALSHFQRHLEEKLETQSHVLRTVIAKQSADWNARAQAWLDDLRSTDNGEWAWLTNVRYHESRVSQELRERGSVNGYAIRPEKRLEAALLLDRASEIELERMGGFRLASVFVEAAQAIERASARA